MKFVVHEGGKFEHFRKKLPFKRDVLARITQFYREAYQLNFVIDSNFEILQAFLTLTFFFYLVSKHSVL
jgi:hypothetical protein